MPISEAQFVALLNSAPVVDGEITETLDNGPLRRLRDDLHRVIRGQADAEILNSYLSGVRQVPNITRGSATITWQVTGPARTLPLAEAVLEWSRVQAELPGRLRPCGNPECNKFLIDHSKPNTARWCSMASCGNRMKARRYQSRQTGQTNG